MILTQNFITTIPVWTDMKLNVNWCEKILFTNIRSIANHIFFQLDCLNAEIKNKGHIIITFESLLDNIIDQKYISLNNYQLPKIINEN